MEWFKHDSSASTDAKIKKLVIRYGAIGYAIYFHCLELICGDVNKNNLTFQLEHDSEIIADNLKIAGTAEQSGCEIVEEIMRYIVSLGLFQSDGSRIFCLKLLNRIDTSMTSNPKFRAMITDAKDHSHDAVMIPSCKKDKIRIDKTDKKDGAGKPRHVFSPPEVEEVKAYCKERKNGVNAQHWHDFYTAKDWMIGKNKMKDWRAAVRTWETKKENTADGIPFVPEIKYKFEEE